MKTARHQTEALNCLCDQLSPAIEDLMTKQASLVWDQSEYVKVNLDGFEREILLYTLTRGDSPIIPYYYLAVQVEPGQIWDVWRQPLSTKNGGALTHERVDLDSLECIKASYLIRRLNTLLYSSYAQ